MSLLVIHTGGTIGMATGDHGLEPRAGVVEQAVRDLVPVGTDLRMHAFDPLVDSSDIGPTDWNRMIEAVLSETDGGVVITHGTDTMAFTGAALSLALVGLPRRVILCGAMKPLGFGGDAESNLAMAVACACGIGPALQSGVWLAFDNSLLPAAGLVKHDSSQASAFRSVPQVLDSPQARRFSPTARVAILTLSPGLPAAAVRAALGELDAAVLRVFGAGTVMNDPDILSVLADAVKAGCRLRAVSQCESGGLVPGSYAAGAGLWDAGVENGGAQTAEAALVSLWLALS